MDFVICAGVAFAESLLLKRAPASLFGEVRGSTTSQTALTLFFLQYLVVKYYRIVAYPKYVSPLRHVPGPTDNHPLIGQALNLIIAKTPTELYIKWMRQYPDAPFIRYLTWANTEVLVPNNLNAHREVLQTQCYSFTKPNWFLRLVKEVAGHGLILMEGDEHRAHRRMLAGPFSLKNIRKLEPIFQEKAKDICRYFDQSIAEGDGKRGAIDCTTTFSKAILDIMGSAILGLDLNYVKPGETSDDVSTQANNSNLKPGCTFHEAYDVFFAPDTMGKILLVVNGIMPVRWLPLQANREFLHAMGWLNDVLRTLIRDRYKQVSESKAKNEYESKDSRDLVTFIVEENLTGGVTEGMGEEEFLGHLLEFMAAGHDTSANMLSWSLYVLATNQDIQEKLRNEVKTLPDSPSYTELDKLSYLENFCKEILRLYSPSTTYQRGAEHDVVVEGVHIPKGTLLDLCPSVTLLNPLIWGESVDEVDPDRWDSLEGDQTSLYTFSAFSNGPKICIGKLFAMFEIKTILAEMVRNFKFVEVAKPFAIENPGFTLRPAGLEVRLERLKGRDV
ncbi:Uu.00g013690.m01.CDS01 [Anthostomella pinea]|uniref:Uu.00g013690.m01.CDS01 n=1 Tax=Anthostomella pinea TaxID=933095 RepID=A0AAI8YQB6_9PEZI|nr:Uu.00g013690.m01.CDS01 [Anthostomella pinea]